MQGEINSYASISCQQTIINSRAACKMPFSFNLCVMLKFLSSVYQLYACGKNFSHALNLNENHHFAKGSVVSLIILRYLTQPDFLLNPHPARKRQAVENHGILGDQNNSHNILLHRTVFRNYFDWPNTRQEA